ncbi:hypothetical protein Slin_3652 [Spirosoma linguale DSM 74]|uniref:Uncharacterized protein n=1 Tax=Spirosoma linguale (strain ATCC 33905 / DSM 74 / LMG 10896 / Claus 1) TaxID=504472 RepID=D2QRA5_SPILD|nr:hypothetical protein Slin_3652 [Spirosoma linguale DSM 74]
MMYLLQEMDFSLNDVSFEELVITISSLYYVIYGCNQLTIRCIFSKTLFISTHF